MALIEHLKKTVFIKCLLWHNFLILIFNWFSGYFICIFIYFYSFAKIEKV